MIDLLIDTTGLVERTSDTLRVQEIVRLSLAPAFLLAGIGALMNVIVARLTWVAERIERMEGRLAEGRTPEVLRSLSRLKRRRRLAQRAMILATSAAATIAMVIALLFVSSLLVIQIGILVVLAWILAMLFLITGLVLFVLETLVAASAQKSDRAERKAAKEKPSGDNNEEI